MILAALQGVKGNVGVEFNAMALKGKKVSVEIAADREAVCAPFPASLCPRFLRRLAPFLVLLLFRVLVMVQARLMCVAPGLSVCFVLRVLHWQLCQLIGGTSF